MQQQIAEKFISQAYEAKCLQLDVDNDCSYDEETEFCDCGCDYCCGADEYEDEEDYIELNSNVERYDDDYLLY